MKRLLAVCRLLLNRFRSKELKMSDLFDMPESLSPKITWMRKHRLSASTPPWPVEDEDDYQWAVWSGDMGIAISRETILLGRTEDEALTKWARCNNVRLWNEEGL